MKAYQDASLAPVRRAKALLEEMTLAEKIGQLNQRFWDRFNQADFKDTILALAYMRDDDYDQQAYPDI